MAILRDLTCPDYVQQLGSQPVGPAPQPEVTKRKDDKCIKQVILAAGGVKVRRAWGNRVRISNLKYADQINYLRKNGLEDRICPGRHCQAVMADRNDGYYCPKCKMARPKRITPKP